MEAAMRRLLAVTLLILVYLVEGVECWWTRTHTITTGGGFAIISLAVSCICCCLRHGREKTTGQRPARGLVVVRTHQIVVDGSSEPTNPYNTGYDQPDGPPYDHTLYFEPGATDTPCQQPLYVETSTDPNNSDHDQRL